MTISVTDILVPACSKIPLLYLLTQKVAQKFGYVLGIGIEIEAHGGWIDFGIGAPVEHHLHVLPVGMVVAEVLVLAG